jgi:molybdate transport system substrate-binding protein
VSSLANSVPINEVIKLKKALSIVLLITFFCLLAGCGGNKVSSGKNEENITVFAAASLSESFTELAREFGRQEGYGIKVDFNFAGSQTLVTSLESGVKADIFASASLNYMDELKNKGLVSKYEIFLRNRLVLIKNKRSEFHIGELKDLASKGMRIAVGDKSVPVGMYWSKSLDTALKDRTIDQNEKNEIESNIKTKELNVKDVVGKVLFDQVDVGVVYATDLTQSNSSKLEAIELPVFEKHIADYPIAVIKSSEQRASVNKFYEFILSEEGKKIFEKYKFIV